MRNRILRARQSSYEKLSREDGGDKSREPDEYGFKAGVLKKIEDGYNSMSEK